MSLGDSPSVFDGPGLVPGPSVFLALEFRRNGGRYQRVSARSLEPFDDGVEPHARNGEIGESDRSMAFGEPFTIGPAHQRHVLVDRRGVSEDVLQHDLSWRGKSQVFAPHDLGDALKCIVDNDGQVVGGSAIVATDNEVVDWANNASARLVESGSRTR